jgi:hypothetical protein
MPTPALGLGAAERCTFAATDNVKWMRATWGGGNEEDGATNGHEWTQIRQPNPIRVHSWLELLICSVALGHQQTHSLRDDPQLRR